MEGSNALFPSVGLEVAQNHFLNEEPGTSGCSTERINTFGHHLIHGFADNHCGKYLVETNANLERTQIGVGGTMVSERRHELGGR